MTRVATSKAVTTLPARGARVAERVGQHAHFLVIAAVAVVVLLAVTRQATFFHDELMFIAGRSFGDPGSWFLPHVQHLVLIHAAVYTALLAIFGTTSYLPFLLVMFATHVAFAASIYALIDRHVGRGPALAAAAILLLLGAGWNNLFWAFQMGAIGAVAMAMWALLVIRERPWLATMLLGLAMATTGYALFVVPAAVLYGWSRRALLAGVVPVALYGAWYFAIGRVSMVVYGDPPELLGVGRWIVEGVAASAAALTGLGWIGLILLVVALGLLLRVPDRRAAAVGIPALLTEYTVLGLSRQGVNAPDASPYVYFGAAFLLPVFASAWPAVPRVARPAVALLAVVALAANVIAMVYWSGQWPGFMALHPWPPPPP